VDSEQSNPRPLRESYIHLFDFEGADEGAEGGLRVLEGALIATDASKINKLQAWFFPHGGSRGGRGRRPDLRAQFAEKCECVKNLDRGTR
jgi:hypothetical protein